MNPSDQETIAANRAAVETARAASPVDSLDLSARLVKLTASLRPVGARAEAESILREALSMRQRVLPEGHPSVAVATSHLARLVEESGRFAEAELLYRRALAAFRVALPAGDPCLNLPLRNLAATMDEMRGDGRLDEAGELFRESLDIRQLHCPPEDHRVAKTKSLLGLTLVSLGRFDEAESLLLAAFEVLSTTDPQSGAGPTRIGETIGRIVLLYER